MDADLRERLLCELRLLEKDRADYASRLEELGSYRGLRLKANKKGGRHYYYVSPGKNEKYKYLGKENNAAVLRIKEAAHLEESVKAIDQNCELTRALLDGHIAYDDKSIDKRLLPKFRWENRCGSSAYDEVGKKWKEEQLRFQKLFPENHPENKTERTVDGIYVKSKNEVVIYNMLLDAGLYHIYELPLVCDDYGPPMYPDFAVLSPLDMKTVKIIEHNGMLEDRIYRDDFARKLGRYINLGFVPNVDIYLTFCDRDGHIDSMQIKKIIADIKGIL